MFCILDIVELETESASLNEVQGPVPLPELSDLLQDAKSQGKMTNKYIDFVKHHGDHLQTFYPRPTKTTLDLYGKLIVEAHPEFKDRIHSTKKVVLPWVNKASFNIVC